MIKLWRIWKYALGSFSDEKTRRYDNYIVLVRSVIFISYLITNCFIISGVIRHWNDGKPMACSSEVEQLTVNQPVAGSIPATPV
jgi:hypothetical protein